MVITKYSKSNSFIIVLSILVSRSFLLILFYFFTAWFLKSIDVPLYYNSARAWWPICLIVTNGILITVLFFVLKYHGNTLFSLLGFDRKSIIRDLISIFWIIPVSILLMFVATIGSSKLLYGDNPPSGLMTLSALPHWAIILSLVVHPIINAFGEEMTYNGFSYPRLNELLHSSWLSVLLVSFFFALQHIAIPFALDGKFILWRFLSFIPISIFWVTIFARIRRLTSLIIVHWLMDIFGILYSIKIVT